MDLVARAGPNVTVQGVRAALGADGEHPLTGSIVHRGWLGSAIALAMVLVVSSCATVSAPAPSPTGDMADMGGMEGTATAPAVASVPTVAPATAAAGVKTGAYAALRVFVASESTNSLWVLEGGGTFKVVGRIDVGRMPHNIAVSPDGRWIAVANRMGNSVSIVDPLRMVEVVRVQVGHQPHDLTWHPDSKTIFVGHERDTFIARIEAGTWRPLAPLMVTVPQHDLAIDASRPNDLFFTVTNSDQADDLRVYDLASGKITPFKVQDVHDVFFTPDATELWTTSSGFIGVSSDRIVIEDPATRTVKQEIHLAGAYPFHTMKHNRDGFFFPPVGTPMLMSDHNGAGLLFIDPVNRSVLSETKLGPQPFHTTYDPLGNRLLTTTNADSAVRVIDLATRTVVQKLDVPAPHGIVAIGIP